MSDFRMRFRKFSRHSNESEREDIGRRLILMAARRDSYFDDSSDLNDDRNDSEPPQGRHSLVEVLAAQDDVFVGGV